MYWTRIMTEGSESFQRIEFFATWKQGPLKRLRPRRSGYLRPRSRPLNHRRRSCFRRWPSWLVSKLLGYKARLSERKQGIWKSRTARTSTSWGALLERFKSIIPVYWYENCSYKPMRSGSHSIYGELSINFVVKLFSLPSTFRICPVIFTQGSVIHYKINVLFNVQLICHSISYTFY